MKNFYALLLSLLLTPALVFSQATAGFHRVAQVITRAPLGSVNAQVVPYATIILTNTATGLTAVAYSDPGLSIRIPNSTLTADQNGNYNYYFALNTCITETISYPNGGIVSIPNVCSTSGGVTVGTLTAAASGGAAPGTTFNGSAAVTLDYHSFGAAGLNAINTFTQNQYISGSNLVVSNPTLATSLSNMPPPVIEQNGNIYNVSGSVPDDWDIGPIYGGGSNPSTTYTFTHQPGSTGFAAVSVPQLIDLGLTPGTGVVCANGANGALTQTGCAGGGGGGTVFCTVNAQTGTTYTLVIGDGTASSVACIGTVTMTNAATNTVTIPPNSSVAFPVPDEIDFIQLGAGQTCIAAGAGVTLNTPTSLCARALNSTFGIRKLATNTWQVFGDTQ